MKQVPYLGRGARWAVPAVIVAAAGGLLAGSMISGAAAAPRLPSRTPGQLLAALGGSAPAPPLTGTVAGTASLGLPALPAAGAPASLASLLAGSHTVKVWYSDPEHYRLAVPDSMSEDDLIRDGRSVWLWESTPNTVTHMTLPAGEQAPPVPLTPQQAADQVLARVGRTTAVSVDSTVTVAGEAAYQLVLAPKSPGSLVGQVRIAVDSQHHVPLRVQVFAKGARSPAAEIGFTSISFARPATSDYAFTPPAGARVVAGNAGSGATPAGGAPGGAPGGAQTNGASVIGTGWLAVADLPESALTAAAASGGQGGPGQLPFRHSARSAAPASAAPGAPGPLGGPLLGGAAGVAFGAVLNSARHVSGPWGSGRLLRTGLVSVLITSSGRVLIGAVTPGVLYRAAAKAGHAAAGLRHTASQAKPR
jgi:outer membrane lipoprotein-sorting protein